MPYLTPLNALTGSVLVATALTLVFSYTHLSHAQGPVDPGTPITAEVLDKHPGKNILEGRCASCHAVPLPQEYTLYEWGNIIKQMGPEASLRKEEVQHLEAFVTLALTGSSTPTNPDEINVSDDELDAFFGDDPDTQAVSGDTAAHDAVDDTDAELIETTAEATLSAEEQVAIFSD